MRSELTCSRNYYIPLSKHFAHNRSERHMSNNFALNYRPSLYTYENRRSLRSKWYVVVLNGQRHFLAVYFILLATKIVLHARIIQYTMPEMSYGKKCDDKKISKANNRHFSGSRSRSSQPNASGGSAQAQAQDPRPRPSLLLHGRQVPRLLHNHNCLLARSDCRPMRR
jgi:hypothetical protein